MHKNELGRFKTISIGSLGNLESETEPNSVKVDISLCSEVDKPRNRANCDKSMKIGESTKFDMLNKIGYRPLLKYGPLCYF